MPSSSMTPRIGGSVCPLRQRLRLRFTSFGSLLRVSTKFATALVAVGMLTSWVSLEGDSDLSSSSPIDAIIHEWGYTGNEEVETRLRDLFRSIVEKNDKSE